MWNVRRYVTIRELKNVIERLLILVEGAQLSAADVRAVLPISQASAPANGEPRTLRAAVAQAERQAILEALRTSSGHIANAARALGLERSHLYKKMRQHGITREG